MVGTMIADRRSFLIEDAAVLLGVSRRTVYYRIRQGLLDTVRTRGGSQRVLLVSIEQLLRRERGLPQVRPDVLEEGVGGGLAVTARDAAV